MKAISSNIKTLIKLTTPFRKTSIGIFHKYPLCFNKYQSSFFAEKSKSSVLQQFVTKSASASKVEDKSKISAKLLCELIGSRYYPTNEEIELDPYSVVTVYDENDKLLGHKNLIDIQNYANEMKKDVVLRNNNVQPPVVKVMKYKIQLLKRLIKKLSKNSRPNKSIAEEKERSTKFVLLSLNINNNDLQHKITKCKDYLSNFTNLRVAIKLESDDKNESFRATNLLKNIAKDLNEFGSVKVQPQLDQCRKLMEKEDYKSYIEEEMFSNNKIEEDIKKEEQQINDAKEELKLTKRGIEKEMIKYEDLANTNVLYMELESLVIDASGIDFEKLLETVSIEDLVKGSTDKMFLDSFKKNPEVKEQEQEQKQEEKEEQEISIQEQLTKIDPKEAENYKLKIDESKKSKKAYVKKLESKQERVDLSVDNFPEKMRKAQLEYNLQRDLTRQTTIIQFKMIKNHLFKYTIDMEIKKQIQSSGKPIEEEEKPKSKKKAEKK